MTAKERLVAYLDHLDQIFGMKPRFYPYKPLPDDGPEILCLVYAGVPAAGHVTAVTFGLSETEHPEWPNTRPELMLTVKSEDAAWALSIAELVRQLRGTCAFTPGDVIGFGERVASDSDMSAFFVLAPSIFESADVRNIEVGDHTIHIVSVYPIYESEREQIERHGLEAFWHHPNFDPCDVSRPAVQFGSS